MGEYVTVDIYVREVADLSHFSDCWGHEESMDEREGYVLATFCEVNYGGFETREKAAKAGLEFHGWHDGSSGCFSPFAFVTDGAGGLLEVPANDDYCPVVALTDLGELQGLDLAHDYLEHRRRLEQLWKDQA